MNSKFIACISNKIIKLLGVLELRSIEFYFLQICLNYIFKLNLSKVVVLHNQILKFLFISFISKGENDSSITYKLFAQIGVNFEQMKSADATGFNFENLLQSHPFHQGLASDVVMLYVLPSESFPQTAAQI